MFVYTTPKNFSDQNFKRPNRSLKNYVSARAPGNMGVEFYLRARVVLHEQHERGAGGLEVDDEHDEGEGEEGDQKARMLLVDAALRDRHWSTRKICPRAPTTSPAPSNPPWASCRLSCPYTLA